MCEAKLNPSVAIIKDKWDLCAFTGTEIIRKIDAVRIHIGEYLSVDKLHQK